MALKWKRKFAKLKVKVLEYFLPVGTSENRNALILGLLFTVTQKWCNY